MEDSNAVTWLWSFRRHGGRRKCYGTIEFFGNSPVRCGQVCLLVRKLYYWNSDPYYPPGGHRRLNGKSRRRLGYRNLELKKYRSPAVGARPSIVVTFGTIDKR
jgi:hypothetical protein